MISSSTSAEMTSVLMNGSLLHSQSNQSLTTTSASTNNYFDPESLSHLRSMSHSDDPEMTETALREIGGHFESILVKQMMDTMREATNSMFEESLFNPQSVQFYQSMLDDQMSVELTGNNGLGLAEQFVVNLADRYGIDARQQRDSSSELNDSSSVERIDSQSSSYALQNIRRQKTQDTIAPSTLATDRERAPAEALFKAVSRFELEPTGPAFLSGEAPRDQQEFVKELYPYARRIGQRLGVEPAEVLAQAALETGWGNKIIRDPQGGNSFNLFGIKADARWNGESVAVRTTEYFSKQPIKVEANFRRYSSYEESFNDFINFIETNGRYQNALAHGGKDFYRHLQHAGYATDPDYAAKIKSLAKRIDREFPAVMAHRNREPVFSTQGNDSEVSTGSRAQVVEKMAENSYSTIADFARH